MLKKHLLLALFTLLYAAAFSQAETQNPTFPFWKVNGNSGIDTSQHFVGTTDTTALTFRTNNIRRATIDVIGNVGIGTIIPGQKLEVNGNIVAGTYNYTRVQLIGAGGSNSIAELYQSEIKPRWAIGRDLLASGNAGIAFGTGNATNLDTYIGRDGVGSLKFQTGGNGNNRITILSTGNVGIGTTAPLQLLHVAGLTNGIRYSGVATGGSFITAPAATTDKILFADANGDLRAMTTGTTGDVLTYSASGPTWSAAGSGTSWLLTGNGSTTPGTNFIGTTDAKQLMFKVNNIQAGYIEYGSPFTTSLGYKALLNNTTGYSNAAFGFLALTANTTGYDNYAFGDSTLANNTTGYHNVAIGTLALNANTTGLGNTAVGYASLMNNSGTLTLNTAVGDYSMTANTTGSRNCAFGLYTLGANTTGINNTALGTWASYNSTIADYTVAIGDQAMYNNSSSDQNIAIGYKALYTFNHVALGDNVAIGDNALYSTSTGLFNTAVGDSTMRNNTSGTGNTALGKNALITNSSGSNNTTVGYNSDVSSLALTNATAIGYSAKVNQSNSLVLGATGANRVSVGIGTTTPSAILHTIAAGAKAVNYSGNLLTNTATSSTASIIKAGVEIQSTGTWNGTSASNIGLYVSSVTGGTANYDAVFNGGGYVGIGTATPAYNLQVIGTTSTTNFQMTSGATNNYILQSDATGNGTWVSAALVTSTNAWGLTGNGSTVPGTNFIGTTDPQKLIFKVNNFQSGLIDYTSPYTTAFGYQALSANTTGYSNAAFGFLALAANTSGFNNLAFGDSTLTNNTTGYHNVAIGTLALAVNTIGLGSTAIGYNSLTNSTGGLNTAVGDFTMSSTTTGTQNCAMGVSDLRSNTTGDDNVAVGSFAMYSNSTGDNNVAIGRYAMDHNVSSSNNIAIGRMSLYNLTAYGLGDNVAIGNMALYNTDYTLPGSAVFNTAVGDSALYNNAAGSGNTALGKNALVRFSSNNNCTAIGYNSGINGTGFTNATAIGYNAKVNQSNALILGATGTDQVKVGIGTTTPGSNLTINGTGGMYNDNEFSFYTDAGVTQKGFIGEYAASSDFTIAATTAGNWMRIGANVASIAFFPDNTVTTAANPKVIITSAGYVGIGTTTPTQAMLVVNGSQNNTISYGYLNSSGAVGTGSATTGYSIYASARVAATEFNAYSDARIKNVKNISNSENDLNTLSKIQITDYQYIDTLEKGNKLIKKVIAQQVEKVFPNAVSKITDAVPDIYQLAEIKNGTVNLKNNLKAGEKVKLILNDKTETFEIISADENGFNVNEKEEGKVFVFGREVNDFRVVDYEALSTLNISATQQLLKMINDLQQENTETKNKLASVSSDVEAIKQALHSRASEEK